MTVKPRSKVAREIRARI